MRGRIERLFQPACADQRRGPPLCINLAHFAGYFDFALAADLLLNDVHRKNRGQILWAERFVCHRMQRGRRGLRQIRDNVVPGLRNLVLRQVELYGLHGHILQVELLSNGAQRDAVVARVTAKSKNAPYSLIRIQEVKPNASYCSGKHQDR